MKKVLKKDKSKNKKKHICPTCKDPFYTQKELLSHQKKIIKCIERDASPKILEPCDCECGAQLGCPDTLKRHIKSCSYMEIQRQLNSQSNIIHSVSPIINLFTQYHILLPYTYEYNIMTFSTEDLNMFLRPENDFFLCLFKFIHCSPTRPQYHNIYYPSGQTQNILVYTTEYVWKKRSTTKIINEILFILRDSLKIFLKEIIRSRNENINESVKNKIFNHIDSIDTKKLTSKNNKIYTETILRLDKNIRLILRKNLSIIFDTFTKTNTNLELLNIVADKKIISKTITEKKPSTDSSDRSFDSSSDSAPSKPVAKKKVISKPTIKKESSDSSSDSSLDSSSDSAPSKPVAKKKVIPKQTMKKESSDSTPSKPVAKKKVISKQTMKKESSDCSSNNSSEDSSSNFITKKKIIPKKESSESSSEKSLSTISPLVSSGSSSGSPPLKFITKKKIISKKIISKKIIKKESFESSSEKSITALQLALGHTLNSKRINKKIIPCDNLANNSTENSSNDIEPITKKNLL